MSTNYKTLLWAGKWARMKSPSFSEIRKNAAGGPRQMQVEGNTLDRKLKKLLREKCVE